MIHDPAHTETSPQGLPVVPELRSASALLEVVPELTCFPALVSALENAAKKPEKQLRVIFSDLDDTLVLGHARPLEQREASRSAFIELAAQVKKNGDALIIVTGSAWALDTATTPSVQKRIESGEIISGYHALVTSGGHGAIGFDSTGETAVDAHYKAMIDRRTSHFHAQQIYDLSSFLVNNINSGAVLADLTPLDFDAINQGQIVGISERIFFQPHIHPDGTVPYPRVSLYFYANSVEERDKIELAFREEFQTSTIVCCEEKDFSAQRAQLAEVIPATKYCLDITPTHKGLPVEHFMGVLEKAANAIAARDNSEPVRLEGWYCGDAANDLVAARRPEISTVVMVGGSSQEFLRHKDGLVGETKRVYVEHDPDCLAAQSVLKALRLRPEHQ
jgi:hypothetical protein